MSSRSKRRRRGVYLRHDPAAQAAVPARRSSWKLALVLLSLSGCVAGAVWWGVKFWGRHQTEPAPLAEAPQTTRSNQTVGEPRRRPDRQTSDPFSSLVNRGNGLMAENKPEQALQVLTEALQLNPADEDVHYDLALALTRLGKVDEAIQQYQEALRLYPQYVEAHNNLGNLLMRGGRTEEAIQHFEAALQVSPDYASAHNNLGTALQRTGRSNEAILHFERAAAINPDYWQAHFNVGTSCLEAGRFGEARTQLQAVLRLKPDFQPAKGALAEAEARQAAAGR